MNDTSNSQINGAAVRFLVAPAIVIVGAVAVLLLQLSTFALTSRPSADLHYIVWATEACLICWLMRFSRVDSVLRTKLMFLLFVIQCVAYLTVRIDGFTGGGHAILAFRWTATPDELFQAAPETTISATKIEALKTSTSSSNYPAFRGANRDGIVQGPDLSNADWDARPPREIWRRTVGVGWSSFAVSGDICVTQEQRGSQEAVVGYEVTTGKQIWVHNDDEYFREITGGNGPRATPAIDSGRVFAFGATGLLNCLNAVDGSTFWQVDVLEDCQTENRLFGMSGSPLVIDSDTDKCVVVCPGGNNASVVAYDVITGQRMWSGGSAPASYSSPHLAKLCGVRQILNFNADGLFAHDADSGNVLWKQSWISNPAERNNVCQPVLLTQGTMSTARVFLSSGYGKGAALLKIQRSRDAFSVSTIWANRNLKAKFTSVVLHDGFLYGLDERILTCIDAATGDRRWKRGRYGYGQLLLIRDTLLIQAENGDVCLVRADPGKHHEITRFQALADRTWNHPVVARRFLLTRNDREAVCFDLSSRDD